MSTLSGGVNDGVSCLHVGFAVSHACVWTDNPIFLCFCMFVPGTVFLTSHTCVIDRHDLHSNYLSAHSLGLAVFCVGRHQRRITSAGRERGEKVKESLNSLSR